MQECKRHVALISKIFTVKKMYRWPMNMINNPAKEFFLLITIFTLEFKTQPQTEVKEDRDQLNSIDIQGRCSYVKGAPTSPGMTTISDDGRTVELVAYGTEFGHHCGEDQGRFAFTPRSGDFDVIVQVGSVANGATQVKGHRSRVAKAGIMAREGNAPGDRYVAIWAISNDALDHNPDAYQFDLRKSPGAWLGNQSTECNAPHECEDTCAFVYGYINKKVHGHLFDRNYPNVWLRLMRKGTKFFAMIGSDGKTWHPTSQPFHEIEFNDQLLVGVALSSAAEGKVDQRANSVFKNIEGLR
jgi:hypothetical protein